MPQIAQIYTDCMRKFKMKIYVITLKNLR